MAVRGFKELVVWQKAYSLALEVYGLTEGFPAKEQYGLTAQMRRCAVSIASNIAEGYQRQHNGEYRHFLSISLGGCAELEGLLPKSAGPYESCIRSHSGHLTLHTTHFRSVLELALPLRQRELV